MNKKLKKNRILKIFVTCFMIGVLIALIYFKNISKDNLKYIINNIKNSDFILSINNNNLIDHLKLISISSLFSLILIGLPIFIGILISEGFNIFIRILFMYKTYKIKGIIYSLIYLLINNGLYIIILYFILNKIIKIVSYLFKYKLKNEPINYNKIYIYLKKIIYLIIINFIYDYLLYLYGNNLLNILKKII